MSIDGKRVVILGGSSGLGLAVARAAAVAGASIVIASSRQARIDEALRTLPAGTAGHVLDLADEQKVKSLFAKLDRFDHLLFTAGETLQLGPLPETDIAAGRGFFNLRFLGRLYGR